MATNPASPEVSSPCKCKLSTKATTNSDPQVVWKKQKSEKLVKKIVTTAPTKKRSPATVPAKTTTGTLKAAPRVAKQAFAQVVPPKMAPKCASVEIKEVDDKSDNYTSIPPCNPRNVLEAADSSDDLDDIDNQDPALELISVNDEEDNDDNDNNENTNPEAPEESADAKLSMASFPCI